jgi:mRNA interferase RelE/StbE
MRFEIRVAQRAERQLLALTAYHRATIRTALETHLRHEPAKLSKSRIKRMRGLMRPQYRLRVGEFRIFYDIVDQEIQIIAIVTKADADRWLAEFAQTDP